MPDLDAPNPQPQGALVISDGGLASLVAAAMASPADALVLWLPPEGTPGIDAPDAPLGPIHRRAAEAQADLLGLRGIEVSRVPPGGPASPSGLCQMLQEACRVSNRLGLDKVVWPLVCGDQLEDLAASAELARLVERLGSVPGRFGADWGPIELGLPLADLGPAQVAELALDLDAPVQSCWWWGDNEDPWAIEARGVWERALREVASERGYAWSGAGAALAGG